MAKLTQAIVTTDISVRFAETDQMGVVHHASYIVWFEVERVAWIEAIDPIQRFLNLVTTLL